MDSLIPILVALGCIAPFLKLVMERDRPKPPPTPPEPPVRYWDQKDGGPDDYAGGIGG